MSSLVKCAICGEEYTQCPNCANTHAWKFYTNKYESYQIIMAIKQYGAQQISKETAKEQLENIGITADTDLSRFKPNVAKKIKDILTVPEKTVIKRSKRSKIFEDEE